MIIVYCFMKTFKGFVIGIRCYFRVNQFSSRNATINYLPPLSFRTFTKPDKIKFSLSSDKLAASDVEIVNFPDGFNSFNRRANTALLNSVFFVVITSKVEFEYDAITGMLGIYKY